MVFSTYAIVNSGSRNYTTQNQRNPSVNFGGCQDETLKKIAVEDLRSRKWFMNKDNPEMTALYLERYLNYGLTLRDSTNYKDIARKFTPRASH